MRSCRHSLPQGTDLHDGECVLDGNTVVQEVAISSVSGSQREDGGHHGLRKGVCLLTNFKHCLVDESGHDDGHRDLLATEKDAVSMCRIWNACVCVLSQDLSKFAREHDEASAAALEELRKARAASKCDEAAGKVVAALVKVLRATRDEVVLFQGIEYDVPGRVTQGITAAMHIQDLKLAPARAAGARKAKVQALAMRSVLNPGGAVLRCTTQNYMRAVERFLDGDGLKKMLHAGQAQALQMELVEAEYVRRLALYKGTIGVWLGLALDLVALSRTHAVLKATGKPVARICFGGKGVVSGCVRLESVHVYMAGLWRIGWGDQGH